MNTSQKRCANSWWGQTDNWKIISWGATFGPPPPRRWQRKAKIQQCEIGKRCIGHCSQTCANRIELKHNRHKLFPPSSTSLMMKEELQRQYFWRCILSFLVASTHFLGLKTFPLVFINCYPVSELATHDSHRLVFHSNLVLFSLCCVDQIPGFPDP